MYSSTSELAKQVCKTIGFSFNVHFVEAMQRNGKIYVRGTAGKPEEFRALKSACEKHGYIYTGTVKEI